MLSVQPAKYTPANLPKMQKVAFKGDDAPKTQDKSNNGKFDMSEGFKQFGKGIASPITSIFSSLESFAVTAGIAGAGLFVINKVKQAGPILIAAGTAFGLFQIGKGIANVIKAKDGDAKEKALFHTGAGVSTVALSVATSKPLLRNSGLIDDAVAVKTSTPKSFIDSFKNLGASIKQTYKATIGKLDKGDGLFVNVFKNKNAYKNFKSGNSASAAETIAGTKEAVTTMGTVLDPNQKKDIDLKRA